MKKIHIIGNLTKDCEIRQHGERSVINFTVAVNTKYRDSSGTQVVNVDYFECSIWRETGKTKVSEFLKKGMLIYVDGQPSSHSYINNEQKPIGVIRIRVDEVKFLSSPSNSNNSNNQQTQQGSTDTPPTTLQPNAEFDAKKDDDDDLPF